MHRAKNGGLDTVGSEDLVELIRLHVLGMLDEVMPYESGDRVCILHNAWLAILNRK